MKYNKVIYISHPYGGKQENEEIVAKLIQRLHKKHPKCLFVSPIHAFSFMYGCIEYIEGSNMCLWLLDQCDEAWVFGDYKNSTGCMEKIAYCKNYLIPYKIITNSCLKIKETPCECHECEMVDFDEYYLMCKKKEAEDIYKEVGDEYYHK